jgi:hypothetical protein
MSSEEMSFTDDSRAAPFDDVEGVAALASV